MDVHIGIVI